MPSMSKLQANCPIQETIIRKTLQEKHYKRQQGNITTKRANLINKI